MSKKKPKIFSNVLIEGFADEGKCVAHHDGAAFFVSNVAPGDLVDVSAIKSKNFFRGRPIKFHEMSPHRQEPVCSHFEDCGGCKWQHVNYQEQLAQKQQIVEDNLTRIGKIDLPAISPIVGSENEFYYRNKLEFTFSNKRWLTNKEIESGEDLTKNALGFHVPRLFDRIVDIEGCHLQPEFSNEIRNSIKKYALDNDLSFYDIREKKGFLRNLIVRNSSIDEWMVIVQLGDENGPIDDLMSFIKTSFPKITSLLYVINTKGNETFHDLEIINYSGRDFIWEELPVFRKPSEKLRFRIGPKSFFQTNTYQGRKLYEIALGLADLKGDEIVYDLYTGTGTIALYAAMVAKKVIGIESVEDAIKDARFNAEENKISNAEFIAGDMKDALNTGLIEATGRPDVIITDPPRAGMHTDVVSRIKEISPQKVVYISCNPATQARDLALLDEKYMVRNVQPVDMFPHTQHIENVVLLVRR